MITSNRQSPQPAHRMAAALLCAALLLPVGVTRAGDRGLDTGSDLAQLSDAVIGTWRASSAAAERVTGDIRISDNVIVFENGEQVSIEPAFSGARNVFAVLSSAGSTVLSDLPFCKSPVTYITLVSYSDFALAMHAYDWHRPPAEPLPTDISNLARSRKCASFYYRMRH